ncbi:hypothetical protein ILYODFUR_036682 [Ilyodon furcidens]|uniref:Uncharacterized protein n=1 Tax=Ilyodon furcidens TaxID=33524 RepID=A0ABV0TPW1_9TELE
MENSCGTPMVHPHPKALHEWYCDGAGRGRCLFFNASISPHQREKKEYGVLVYFLPAANLPGHVHPPLDRMSKENIDQRSSQEVHGNSGRAAEMHSLGGRTCKQHNCYMCTLQSGLYRRVAKRKP